MAPNTRDRATMGNTGSIVETRKKKKKNNNNNNKTYSFADCNSQWLPFQSSQRQIQLLLFQKRVCPKDLRSASSRFNLPTLITKLTSLLPSDPFTLSLLKPLSGSNAPKQMGMEVLQRGQYFMIFMRKKGRVHGMIISAGLLQICFLL